MAATDYYTGLYGTPKLTSVNDAITICVNSVEQVFCLRCDGSFLARY